MSAFLGPVTILLCPPLRFGQRHLRTHGEEPVASLTHVGDGQWAERSGATPASLTRKVSHSRSAVLPHTGVRQLSTRAPCAPAGVALPAPAVWVSGSDMLPLSLALGTLCEGQHPEESSAAQLHPSEFPGGGHGGFPR